MNRDKLVEHLHNEIASRDERIGELENVASYYASRNEELREEVAAIKARSVVMPKGAIMVGRSELALVRSALALDCEQGCSARGEMLAELDASIERFDRLNAAPVQQVSVPDGWTVMPNGSKSMRISHCVAGMSFNDDEPDRRIVWLVDFLRAIHAAPAAPAPAADAGLLASAENCSFVMRQIASMDAEDIYGADIDLRFEGADGRDTGCDVSIVDYAEKTADVLDALIAAHRAKGLV